ncbi:MAG: D-aminoacyl-tRNA deacylase [Bryobacteraceae bacterium]|nr:D-aminoacyl-tRNA deacylase [Bryobacteraceae bacterium]
MRIVVQRVLSAAVEVDGEITGQIGTGLLVLLGIESSDLQRDADYLAVKMASLRIFSDENGKMNRSVQDVAGAILVVSQFTLYGECRKGNRPSYDRAARPEPAKRLYEYFVGALRAKGVRVETGIFQASMKVTLVNDGPVTIICESRPV